MIEVRYTSDKNHALVIRQRTWVGDHWIEHDRPADIRVLHSGDVEMLPAHVATEYALRETTAEQVVAEGVGGEAVKENVGGVVPDEDADLDGEGEAGVF